ncbi:Uncharacterized protein SCF082_LOCUS38331 [Durusdinium trenchii]|uniref:Uncharacterized protein n=1 Tax=Durusdinium trenchii TaxID=1381693 RepID=A0ABP0PX91_9DINO
MNRLMNHEPLAAGVFNSTYNGASSQLSMWDGHLDNSVEVLELMCERMEKDWLNLNPKFRKSYGFKELATGLRLDMFLLRHLDSEFSSMLESGVPPIDINAVSAFRSAINKYAKEVSDQNFKAAEKLANLDIKYLTDRYSRGKLLVDDATSAAKAICAVSWFHHQFTSPGHLLAAPHFWVRLDPSAGRESVTCRTVIPTGLFRHRSGYSSEDSRDVKRYNEWGKAVAEMQKHHLQSNAGHEYFFTAYYSEEEAKDLQNLASEVQGGLVTARGSFFQYQQPQLSVFWAAR